MSRVVTFENLWCVFEHRSGQLVNALQDVNFDVQSGEFVCVVGRSGHGKTTLLRVLAGLQPPTSGQVRLGDDVVSGPGADRAMVFQQDTVFPWLHVKENVEFGLRAMKTPEAEREEITAHWLDAVGLTDFADSWPRELSGGMRKRVALASAMAVGSDVILMDEPFGSLDYFTRRNLHDVLLDLWEESQKTIFFVTHDIEEALILADRVILLAEGKLVDDIPVTLPRPRDEDVRAGAEAVQITKVILAHLGITEEEATKV